MLVTPFALACTHCDGSYGPLMAVVAPEGHPPSRRDERLLISGHGSGDPPWRMKMAARKGPWAVDCSAEGASAASTVSVTCEFALATGHFQPRHIHGMRSCWTARHGLFSGRIVVTVIARSIP
jgi:hypothetical protein